MRHATISIVQRLYAPSAAAIVCVGIMIVLLPTGPVAAEPPYQLAWGRQIGTANADTAWSVAVDASGNAYMSGYTWGNLAGLNAGAADAFLVKYDASGNLLWARQTGTTGSDWSKSVAVDAFGNSYISGFSAQTSWPFGTDASLIKYDASGNLLWSRQFGTIFSSTLSTSVAVDASGSAYITGSNGSGPFLAKYDSAGNLLWSQCVGLNSNDDSQSVAIDEHGNAFITGHTDGSFSPRLNAGAFLVKYDAAGNLLWARNNGVTTGDYGRSVAVDASGSAYSTGWSNEGFLTKYDASGNLLWSQQIGGGAGSNSVAVDAFGNSYISGDRNAGAFLTKCDGSGSVLWSQQIDGAWSNSVAVDVSGNAYISGDTGDKLFAPNAGGNDAFLIKFEAPEPATLTLLALGGLAMLRRRK